jgi:hypothetical protein
LVTVPEPNRNKKKWCTVVWKELSTRKELFQKKIADKRYRELYNKRID